MPTHAAIIEVPSRIDRDHFGRVTLGDVRLAREVLDLFDRQAVTLLARLRAAAPEAMGQAAHTLKGSARGIGAWDLAVAVESLEQAAMPQKAAALARLGELVGETRRDIVRMLQDDPFADPLALREFAR